MLMRILSKTRGISLLIALSYCATGKSQLDELTGKSVVVCMEDFKNAIGKFVPSISKSDLDYFNNLRDNFGS